ncbi:MULTISPECIES: IS110 family transposase [unclassified Pseudomonas]|jgi:transposase|uniref:IS110 family transposase n=1 Tax=unclassified Pseudomonas TaxID=196821 RepID=UPI000D344BA4|nr:MULTISPECIES: IS110 family transposase [unclassified Pseudomonas]PTR14004.1 transposase IS116/IS110/IS902 family protein [Pseudomonas sp. GV085]
MARKNQKRFEIIHHDCAGIDVGSREHWVAVNPGRGDNPVRKFSTFTDDLIALADWLASLKIKVVAMEATGVYWIPLFEVLDARGFEVYLVNSRATRQTSGRKSDVLDCQWIWQLMTHGLLSGAFRPSDEICSMRSLVRQRANKVCDQAKSINRMQKALSQMNIHLANVISDITGVTGMKILNAINQGERDPLVLAALRDRRIKADQATIARSLHGNWRAEHLHALSQELACHDFLETQIADCDKAIAQALERLPRLQEAVPVAGKVLRSPHRSAAQQSALHQALGQVMGVDLTAIPTIGVDTALVLASELGPDLSRFPTSQHFCSWLGVAPPTRISGGKALPGKPPKVINRASQALKQSASNARNDKSFIGASHRARLTRMDTGCAIKATAHQLARLIYAMLTKGQPYVEKGIEAFEAKSRSRQLRALEHKARKLGMQLVMAG